MRVFVAVNQTAEVGYRQTTALLIAALARLGFQAEIAAIEDVSFQGATKQQLRVDSISVLPDPQCTSESVETLVRTSPKSEGIFVQPEDVIWVRTNPGRDLQRTETHETFLNLCRTAKLAGTRVVNDPANLKFFASKASLATIGPRFRPPMLVTHDPTLAANFVRAANRDCVVKPLVGSRGENVIRISSTDKEAEQKIAKSFAQRGIIVQHFVDSTHAGDKRVITLNGRVLEVDGHLAGIERRPAIDDFRGNLHAGGTAYELSLSPAARATAEHAAKFLNSHGIGLAGVDLIEDQIIEFNVFSTGGLYDAIRFSGVDFAHIVVREIFGQPHDG